MRKILILGNGLVGNAIFKNLTENQENQVFSLTRRDLDFRNSTELETRIGLVKPDVVIIAAGVVGGIERNTTEPLELGLQNSEILVSVVRVCVNLRIENVINLVPACVYPANLSQRMNPADLWTGPMEQSSLPYSTAKMLGLVLIEAARAQFKFNWISVISTNLYGDDSSIESHKAHVIPALLRKFHKAKLLNSNEVRLLGDGTSVREFLHADDFANAIEHIIKKQLYVDSIINISGPNLCTVRELSQIIRKVACYEGNVVFSNDGQNGAAAKLLDGTRLKESEWEPRISLEEGIVRAYANLLP